MPDNMKHFLEDLRDDFPDHARKLLDWLDGDPDAIHEMIAVLAKRRKKIKKGEGK